jgi:hypothetical protein
MVVIKGGSKIDINKIKKCIRKDEILVGYPTGLVHGKSGVDVSELAKNLYYGNWAHTDYPFLTDGLESQRDEIEKAINESYKKLCETGKTDNVKIANMAVNAVKEFVRGDYYKTNKPKLPGTIAAETSKSRRKKGHLDKIKPLIDTGQLINSCTYQIVEGGL